MTPYAEPITTPARLCRCGCNRLAVGRSAYADGPTCRARYCHAKKAARTLALGIPCKRDGCENPVTIWRDGRMAKFCSRECANKHNAPERIGKKTQKRRSNYAPAVTPKPKNKSKQRMDVRSVGERYADILKKYGVKYARATER